ncbi:MAG TPA: hypothetical protein VF171_09940 [Trueperaceae bacterium]
MNRAALGWDMLQVCLALVVLLAASGAHATSYRALDLPQLAARADVAFFGTVRKVGVVEQGGQPWTRVTFRVDEALLGEPGDDIELLFYGGSLPTGESLSVVGMPQFQAGEQVLILAYDTPYYSPVVGFSQGLWRLTERGLEDDRGRVLSLDEEGKLLRSGGGGGTQEVLAAMKALLEARQ